MKTIFESHCGDDCYEAVGAKKLKNSFEYFHSDHELRILGDADLNKARQEYPWAGWASFDPILCGQFKNDYDLIVHVDADSIITGTLDDILIGDYELAGVRNNNDLGLASATRCTFGYHIPGLDAPKQYLNAGLIAVHSLAFWDEFLYEVQHMPDGGLGEQDVWNRLFWSNKYKTKVLDPKEAKVYYGVAAQEVPDDKPMEYSWSQMYMKNNQLWFKDKVVKIIHNAGGFGLPKLQYQKWVSPEVKDFLDTITEDK